MEILHIDDKNSLSNPVLTSRLPSLKPYELTKSFIKPVSNSVALLRYICGFIM